MNNIDILERLEYFEPDDLVECAMYRECIKGVENLISENKELKEENKKFNIIILEMLLSQFPDTTETYKKYKKELQSLLGKE